MSDNALASKALLGRKLGMTQVWDEDGKLVPVTVIQVEKNVVTQIRTAETDGYAAVQLGFGELPERKVTKPMRGHFAKAGVTPRRHLAEVRTAEASSYELGQELGAETFEAGNLVDVSGTTKGKGFAGVMKRHGFQGVSASHGWRVCHPGSCFQGFAHGWPHGFRALHHHEPQGSGREPGKGLGCRGWRHPRAKERHRDDSYCCEGSLR